MSDYLALQLTAVEILNLVESRNCDTSSHHQIGCIARRLTELVTQFAVGCSSCLPEEFDKGFIDRCLEHGAYESAVLNCLSGSFGYLLSRSLNGKVVATVIFGDGDVEYSATGDQVVTVLAAAIAGAILQRFGYSIN